MLEGRREGRREGRIGINAQKTGLMILCARRVRPAYPSLKTEVARCLAIVQSVRNQVIR